MKDPICLGLMNKLGLSGEENIECLHRTGFSGAFTVWNPAHLTTKDAARFLKARGMIFQSVHAPWEKTPELWEDETEAGNAGRDELLGILRECADAEVPIMVCHAIKGMERCTPTAIGLERFSTVFTEAEKLGVTVAVENVEGDAYLKALYENFKDSPAFGFCWDTGHERCYNHSVDQLALYGDRLVMTHLNDNLGISDPGGKITWLDDLHLLPFDGNADWNGIVDRLNALPYEGILTFELTRFGKPGRHEHERYAQLSDEEYIRLCFERALQVRELKENRKGNRQA